MPTLYEIETMQSNLEGQFSELFEFVDESIGTVELHELEKSLFEKLQKVGLFLLEYFLAKSGTGYKPGNPPVSNDGKPLEYKGPVKSPYFSIFGEVTIERARHSALAGRFRSTLTIFTNNRTATGASQRRQPFRYQCRR
ncbi:MAG: hypothetical protein ACE5I1_07865 [bacterium]